MSDFDNSTLFMWYPLLVLSNGYIGVELMRRLDNFEEECPGYYNDDLCYASGPSGSDDVSVTNSTDVDETGNKVSKIYKKKRHVNIDTVRNVGYVVLFLLALAVVLWGVIVGMYIKNKCVSCPQTPQGEDDALNSSDESSKNLMKALAVVSLILTIFSTSYVFYFSDVVRTCENNEWKRDEDHKTKESQYQMVNDVACVSIGLSIPSIITIMYRTFRTPK
jgi:hypothetical protein